MVQDECKMNQLVGRDPGEHRHEGLRVGGGGRMVQSEGRNLVSIIRGNKRNRHSGSVKR